MRGATVADGELALDHDHFNPRAPCGARRDRPLRRFILAQISTHAPLAGRDGLLWKSCVWQELFQPTRPLRGATQILSTRLPTLRFQPTRPLRGATIPFYYSYRKKLEFQPTRPLRGATRRAGNPLALRRNFNPRAPCGARRHFVTNYAVLISISTHAPLAGRDRMSDIDNHLNNDFNPRAPCGARQIVKNDFCQN